VGDRPLPELLGQRLAQPRLEGGVEAAEDHRARVDDVDRGREAHAQRPPGRLDRPQGVRVAGAGPGQQLGHRAAGLPDAGADGAGQPGRAQDRLLAGDLLQAAAGAAAAARAVRLHGDVADLAGEAPDPAEQLAADDDAAADPDLARHVDEVPQVAVASEPELAQGGQVGLVVGHHRDAGHGQPVGQDLGHGHVDPAEVWGQPEQPAVGLDRPGHGHGQPGQGELGALGRRDGRAGHPQGPGQHLGRGLAPVVPRPGPEVADLPDEVGHAHGDVVDVDLEPDPDEAGPVEDQGAARPADLAPGLRAQLGDQPGADQVVDQAGHGRLGQARAGGDAGPGHRLVGGDVLEHQGEVMLAERVLPGRRPPRLHGDSPRCLVQPLNILYPTRALTRKAWPA